MSQPAVNPTLPAGRQWLVPAAFILLGCLWGSSFLWIKMALVDVPPGAWWRCG